MQKGKLVMVTNAEFPPYEFHDQNAIVGIDVEIAGAIAEQLGLELEIEDIAFDSIIPEIVSGKADIGAAGMTVTEDRKQNVDFSDTYAHATQVIIVKEDSEIKGGAVTTAMRLSSATQRAWKLSRLWHRARSTRSSSTGSPQSSTSKRWQA